MLERAQGIAMERMPCYLDYVPAPGLAIRRIHPTQPLAHGLDPGGSAAVHDVVAFHALRTHGRFPSFRPLPLALALRTALLFVDLPLLRRIPDIQAGTAHRAHGRSGSSTIFSRWADHGAYFRV